MPHGMTAHGQSEGSFFLAFHLIIPFARIPSAWLTTLSEVQSVYLAWRGLTIF